MIRMQLFARCLGLWLAFACLPLAAAVVMPLEAIGANGTIAEGTVNVPQGSTATKLWLQVHGLTYQEKASIQVNNGSWIPLRNNNSAVEVAYPDKGYGGVGGIFQTIRLTVAMPSGLVMNGANTVRIRLNQTDNLSISVRLLAFNFLNASGAKLVAASEFVADDPTTWTPPAGTSSSADIAAGDSLWSSAALVNHPGGPSIQAKCSMCHDPEGADLKYFNYSNKAIVERSKFHGLTQKQGEQIAAYIRSQSIVAPGRQWNPPYQPGPGLDAKPAAEWSAGAGLEWVVTDERDAVTYLPGAGVSKEAYIDANRHLKTINLREIPQILQFLDWNRWLPVVHPIDVSSNWSTAKAKTGYDKVRKGLLGQSDMTKDQYIRGPMRRDIDDWAGPETDVGGVNLTTAPGQDTLIGRSSVRQLNAVRMWGLTHEFELHDLGEQLYGSQGEKRMFFSNRLIFNLAPHILRPNEDDVRLVVDSTHSQLLDWDAVTDSWYRMQTLLNGGQRNSFKGGHHDVDWKYNWYFGGQSNKGNGFFPIVGLGLSLKSMQEIDGGFGPEGADKPGDFADNSWFGFNLRDGRPELGHITERDWGANWTTAEKAALLAPVYAAWTEKLAMFPASSWEKVNTPEFQKKRDYTWGGDRSDESYPDFLKQEIIKLKEFGIPDAITTGLADHGKFTNQGHYSRKINLTEMIDFTAFF